ncbi:YdeI/OmpD-associated family protein [Pedobacter foliorum]|uniref:YdeI/OmpD-associated family protein n=1 Tax=Pedobacter foliorum TaxID=2739058 RepID=UPI001562F8F3|nr:YdeI/OmpD-associated family protein [Pedobacter foliorum]
MEVPDYFATAPVLYPEAEEVFKSKSLFFQKDCLVWIIDAKTEATTHKKTEQALLWIT